jgi:hypothetical protein
LDVDAAAANVIGYNAGDSLDKIVLRSFAAGSNVAYATGGASAPSARVDMAVDDLLVANDVRKQVAASA